MTKIALVIWLNLGTFPVQLALTDSWDACRAAMNGLKGVGVEASCHEAPAQPQPAPDLRPRPRPEGLGK